MLPQVKPEYRPENDRNDVYRITLYAGTRGVEHILPSTGDSNRPDFVPGTHSIELVHGTARLILRVWQREERREMQRLVIKDDILLEKNKTTEIKLK